MLDEEMNDENNPVPQREGDEIMSQIPSRNVEASTARRRVMVINFPSFFISNDSNHRDFYAC
jgi:hypothetical protein